VADGSEYFTDDKQDAIDTANAILNDKMLDNPPGGAKMPQAFTYHDALKVVADTRGGDLGANTTIFYAPGSKAVYLRLHGTDIITWHADGDISLNTGGYATRTTLGRMNAFLSPFVQVFKKGGTVYARTRDGQEYPFRGMHGHGLTLAPENYNVPSVRRNPGKFSSPLDEYMYMISLGGNCDESLGDVQEHGVHYCRMNEVEFADVVQAAFDSGEDEHSARKAWQREFGMRLRGDTIPVVIVSEDSQGFVSVSYYTSARDGDRQWAEVERDIDEHSEDDDE
jgi:hypothetical protein